LYFQTANITGQWVHSRGGRHFSAKTNIRPKWMRFREIQVKVVGGRTIDDKRYLNIFVKGVGKGHFPVGGLLGGDDHTLAAKVSEGCKRNTWL
jgi:hypothetical protein